MHLPVLLAGSSETCRSATPRQCHIGVLNVCCGARYCQHMTNEQNEKSYERQITLPDQWSDESRRAPLSARLLRCPRCSVGQRLLCCPAGVLTLVHAHQPGSLHQYRVQRASPGHFRRWTEPLLLLRAPGGFGGSDLWVAQRLDRNADWEPAQNLGPGFCTTGDEFGVELSPDAHWLFFCSDGLPDAKGNNLNIFVAFRSDTADNFGWGLPANLGKGINGDHLNCDPTVFVDPETGVTTLYFARLNKPGQGDWDIYVSTLQPDGTFGNAVLDPELSSRYRDTHPTVRRDGLELIFSSDRPGSLGRIDLWISTRATTHDKWSTPVNLGAGVNTPYDERAPYLSDDGLTLIFSSDRPGGLGGTDFYMISRKRL